MPFISNKKVKRLTAATILYGQHGDVLAGPIITRPFCYFSVTNRKLVVYFTINKYVFPAINGDMGITNWIVLTANGAMDSAFMLVTCYADVFLYHQEITKENWATIQSLKYVFRSVIWYIDLFYRIR